MNHDEIGLPERGIKHRRGHLVTVRKQRSGLVEIQDIDVGAII